MECGNRLYKVGLVLHRMDRETVVVTKKVLSFTDSTGGWRWLQSRIFVFNSRDWKVEKDTK